MILKIVKIIMKKKIKILFLMIIITVKVKGNPKGIFYIINYTCSAFVNRLNYTIQTEIESNRLQNVSKRFFSDLCLRLFQISEISLHN